MAYHNEEKERAFFKEIPIGEPTEGIGCQEATSTPKENYFHSIFTSMSMRNDIEEQLKRRFEELNAFHNAMWDRLHRYYCKYIEKQGEQKPTDKVEPKFKVGDWIVENCNYFWKVAGIMNGFYILEYGDEGGIRPSTELADKTFHLWTIHDAKPGDVLFYEGNVKHSDGIKFDRILLFKNLDKSFFVLTKFSNGVEDYAINANIDYSDNITPATKEQCDLLFQKMKEEGYEWDAEKKKLKKLEEIKGEFLLST